MVSVYGDIETQDDYTHPLGPETNFNESMYFNFFDNAKGLRRLPAASATARTRATPR